MLKAIYKQVPVPEGVNIIQAMPVSCTDFSASRVKHDDAFVFG